jgi:tyrosine-protein kinase Etk/Wzc
MRGRINELEKKKVSLAGTYNATHPFIKAVDDEIASLYPAVGKLAEDTRALYRSRLSQTGGEISRNLPGGGSDMALNLEAKRLSDEKDNATQTLNGLQSEYEQARLNAGPNVFKVDVIDAARQPLYEAPTFRSRLVFSAAAAVLAFFPGLLWVLLSQILFPRIWNKDDAERKLKVKVIGSLFHMPSKPNRRKASPSQGGLPVDDRLIHHGRLSGPADVEAYRALRVEIEHRFDPEPGRSALCILVTSTQPNEGKSLIAANLAVGFARRGRRTLLVDVDFRHGRQEEIFGYSSQRGLADLLRGGIDPDFARRTHGMLLPTCQPNLSVMPRGSFDEAAMEAAYRTPMEYYIQAACRAFEVVILDAPPVIVTADPLNLARLASGVVYAIRSGEVTAHDAARALEPFLERGFPMGVVVNGIRRSPSDENYYARYGYYYLTPKPEAEFQKPDAVGKPAQLVKDL